MTFPSRISLLLCGLLGTLAAMGQKDVGKVEMTQLVSPEWKTMTQLAGADWESTPGVSGNMFLTESWSTGYVLLKDRRMADGVPLRFNVLTNEIYFRQHDTILVLDKNAPVLEFGFGPKLASLLTDTVFRRGYPELGRNNGMTFYRVLADGKLVLLQQHLKSISDRLNGMTGPEKVIIDSEAWFIYNSGDKSIRAVRNTRHSLEEALPQYAQHIRDLLDHQGYKLKTERDWALLFQKLNEGIE
jgi:hypothetical protein